MLREYMYAKLSSDATMNALGLNAANIFANGSPDSVNADLYAIMRWGEVYPGLANQRGLGRAFKQDFTLWVFNLSADYAIHNQILQRVQVILDAVESESTGAEGGYLIQADWAGQGIDDFDEAYQRYYRNGSWMLTATGS